MESMDGYIYKDCGTICSLIYHEPLIPAFEFSALIAFYRSTHVKLNAALDCFKCRVYLIIIKRLVLDKYGHIVSGKNVTM